MYRFLISGLVLVLGCAHSQPSPQNATKLCGKPSNFSDASRFLTSCAKDRVIKLTSELVRFPTVSATGPVHQNRAFIDMAKYLEQWSKAHGLEFKVYGAHDAWVISYGEGPEKLGFMMHSDIVPVNQSQWSTPAFETVIKEGRLYGRGTEDDKGPIAAAMVILETLSAFNIKTRGKIQIIMGTAEESNWDGMRRYAKTSTQPEHLVSIDASYPVVIAESGFVSWTLGIEKTSLARISSRASILELKGGNFLTQVPGEAWMILKPGRNESYEALKKRIQSVSNGVVSQFGAPFSATVSSTTTGILLTTFGKAVHSSTSEDGANALWLLAAIANELDLNENEESTMLTLIHNYLNEHYGEKLGLAYSHEIMGPLAVIPSLLRKEDNQLQLSINMRRPAGKTKAEFQDSLNRALKVIQDNLSTKVKQLSNPYIGDPALARTDGPLVDTLIDVYRKHTKDVQAQPVSIRGGTYARLFDGSVSFGPSMPGKEYRGHAPDEYIEIATLHRMVHMLFEATQRLAIE
ncbi:MAG: Sapep family Mn(2+)-dependent dipeptidase [Myxococcota bacterium]|nr:Sapep family Mn(2+)-dependent dipeptidase [Myxococcota bacterium]